MLRARCGTLCRVSHSNYSTAGGLPMAMKTLDPDPEFTLGAVPSETIDEAGRCLPTPERTVKPMILTFGILAVVVGAIAFYLYWPRGVTLPQQVLPTPPAST